MIQWGFCCLQMQWSLQSTSYNVLVNASAFPSLAAGFLTTKYLGYKWVYFCCFPNFHTNLDLQFVKSLPQYIYIYIYIFFFFFWLYFATCGILVTRPGLNPCPLQWECNLNHWTTKEVPTAPISDCNPRKQVKIKKTEDVA